MYYYVTDIEYETDGAKINDLPDTFIINLEDDCDPDEDLANHVSDITGWLVNSLSFERLSLRETHEFIANKIREANEAENPDTEQIELLQAELAELPDLGMTYDEWAEKFQPIEKHERKGNRVFDLPDDEEAIQAAADAGTLWTVVDTDWGDRILPGYHLVNRIYYLITKVPDDGSVEEAEA